MRRLNKKYWPYVIHTKMISDREDDAVDWCRRNLPGKERWILAGPNQFYFKKEKDVTLFSLRWSS